MDSVVKVHTLKRKPLSFRSFCHFWMTCFRVFFAFYFSSRPSQAVDHVSVFCMNVQFIYVPPPPTIFKPSLALVVSVWSLSRVCCWSPERDDGGGEEAGPPEGAGQSLERRSQAPSDGAEGRAADPEVSVQTSAASHESYRRVSV